MHRRVHLDAPQATLERGQELLQQLRVGTPAPVELILRAEKSMRIRLENHEQLENHINIYIYIDILYLDNFRYINTRQVRFRGGLPLCDKRLALNCMAIE